MQNLAVGIDIGGTNTKIGLINEQGKILSLTKIATESESSFHDYLVRVEKAINDLNPQKLPLKGIGIGAPCASGITGIMENPPNLAWGTTPIKQLFENHFKLPIIVENDANISALGEGQWGIAQNLKDYIVVTLGTGVGTGIIVNGQLLRGSSGLAGEGGHITIIANGRKCNCGGLGHLEAYCSVRGIKQTYKELFNGETGFREMSEKYEQGDAKAMQAVDQTADYLGQGLAIMTALFMPDLIILAGGVSSLGDSLAIKTQAALNRYVFPIMKDKVPVKISKISTSDGAILGAASLVFNK